MSFPASILRPAPALALALLAGLGTPAPGATPETPSATNTPPARGDYAAFRIIAERNIFNPARSGRASTTPPRESRRSPRVDAFALVGTMAYEKGSFAFFDGSSPEYRKVLKPGDAIAGHTVREIRAGSVQLEAGDKSIELKVRSQMRREEGGEWSPSTLEAGATFASSAGSSGSGSGTGDRETSSSTNSDATAAAPASGGSDDEVLKRLLRKREQELK